MAKLYGMDKPNASIAQIQDLVARVVNGWYVHDDKTANMSAMAAAFAAKLQSHAHRQQDIKQAFFHGFLEGTGILEYFSRRRRPAQRLARRA